MTEIAPINSAERVPLKDVIPLKTPYAVYVFPTTFCNFKCVYCAHALGYDKMKEVYGFEPQMMSLETYSLIIEQLKEFGEPIKLLSLTGQGEPLINKNLPEMVRRAKCANVAKRIEFISNAALLTRETADALIDAGLDCLRVSIQGVTAEKYKEVCGVDLNFSVFLDNLLYYFDKSRGRGELFIKIIDLALGEGREDEFYSMFDGLCDRMYVEKARPVYDGVAINAEMKEDGLDRWGNAHEHRKVCPLCFFQLGIFPNGDVEPDDTIYKPVILGNVHNETLKEMFQGEKLREFQIMQLQGKRYENPKCAVCCAPDDVSHPLDDLDGVAREILRGLEGEKQ